MKVATSALLVGAASAAITPPQQVLNLPQQIKDAASSAKDAWTKPLHNLEESLKSLSGDARQIWDEVAMMFPESFDNANFWSMPKPHTRRHDSEWDHIMRGSDIQSVWVTNSKGEKERDIEGHLEPYSLRTKKVDPSSLGVDKVKQYSGYLDDDENDKHLFYCKRIIQDTPTISNTMLQGSSSLEMIRRTTQSSFGSTAVPAALH